MQILAFLVATLVAASLLTGSSSAYSCPIVRSSSFPFEEASTRVPASQNRLSFDEGTFYFVNDVTSVFSVPDVLSPSPTAPAKVLLAPTFLPISTLDVSRNRERTSVFLRTFENGAVYQYEGSSTRNFVIGADGEVGFNPRPLELRDVRFGSLDTLDIVPVPPATLAFVDTMNHCVQGVRDDERWSLVAGACTEAGFRDGSAVEARFKFPRAAIVNKSSDVLYLLDDHGIRTFHLDSGVSTIPFPAPRNQRRWQLLAIGPEGLLVLSDLCDVVVVDPATLTARRVYTAAAYGECSVVHLAFDPRYVPSRGDLMVFTTTRNDIVVHLVDVYNNCGDSVALLPIRNQTRSSTSTSSNSSNDEQRRGGNADRNSATRSASIVADVPTTTGGGGVVTGQPPPTPSPLPPSTRSPPATTPRPSVSVAATAPPGVIFPTPAPIIVEPPKKSGGDEATFSSQQIIIIVVVVLVAALIIIAIICFAIIQRARHNRYRRRARGPAAEDVPPVSFVTRAYLDEQRELGTKPRELICDHSSYDLATTLSTSELRNTHTAVSVDDVNLHGDAFPADEEGIIDAAVADVVADAAAAQPPSAAAPDAPERPDVVAAAATEAMHQRRHRLIEEGKFTRLKLLGRGASGVVYSCVLDDGALVAVKEIALPVGDNDGTSGDDTETMAQIQKEIEAVASLRHPNVIKYYCAKFDPTEHKVQLFMEHAANGTVTETARQFDGAMPEAVAKIYVRQIVEGLAYIHSKGVMHRDLKADNALLTHDGVVKLADFGASRVVGNTAGASRAANTMIGTPTHIAPDVLLGALGDDEDGGGDAGYGRKADVWSLGITCLEILNRGEPPWPKFANPGAAFMHIASPEGLPIVPEHLSDACKDFVRRCCHRDARQRATAAELLQHPWLTGVM